MLDVRRPGAEVQAALARKEMYVGRIWPAWPTQLRITVGTREHTQLGIAALEASLGEIGWSTSEAGGRA